MSLESPSQPKTSLEKLERYTLDFRNDIEQRVSTGTESWIGFAVNKVFVFDTLLQKQETQAAIDPDKLQLIQVKMMELNTTMEKLKARYDYDTPMDSIEEKEDFYHQVEQLLAE